MSHSCEDGVKTFKMAGNGGRKRKLTNGTKESESSQTDDSKSKSCRELLRLENDELSLPNLLIKNKNKYGEISRVPPSTALNRIKNFLPDMKKANEDLQRVMKTDPDKVNMEKTDNIDKVIEMNLMSFQYSDDSQSEEESCQDEDDSDTNSKQTKHNLIEEL